MSLRSPLSRVLGSGSAKDGTEHWWQQRVTAAALLILGGWFVVSIAGLEQYGQAQLANWMAHPFNATMMILLGVTLAWHSSLGVQVVIEDYVHGPALKVLSLVLSKFAHTFLAITAVLAVLKLSLGSAV